MSTLDPRVMRQRFITPYRHCGKCRQLYHGRTVYRGRGRHLGEHPEHDYAPCGHSQTWFGFTPAEIEPEPRTGLEFHDPEEPDHGGRVPSERDGFTVTSDADPGL